MRIEETLHAGPRGGLAVTGAQTLEVGGAACVDFSRIGLTGVGSSGIEARVAARIRACVAASIHARIDRPCVGPRIATRISARFTFARPLVAQLSARTTHALALAGRRIHDGARTSA